jgi:hypothetical protein
METVGESPYLRVMHLDRSDGETAALTKELDDIAIRAHPHTESDPRQAQTRAGPRAFAVAEGLCAAASNHSEEGPTRL